MAGAFLIEQFYKKRSQAVAGAAFYKLEEKGVALAFANQQSPEDLSSYDGFHYWVLCEGYVIDFMAPLFRESLQTNGATTNLPRKMFQKPRSAIVDSPLLMQKPGDFYMLPNVELTNDVIRKFFSNKAAGDLINICAHWYKKPPKIIAREFTMQDDRGADINMVLSDILVAGAW